MPIYMHPGLPYYQDVETNGLVSVMQSIKDKTKAAKDAAADMHARMYAECVEAGMREHEARAWAVYAADAVHDDVLNGEA